MKIDSRGHESGPPGFLSPFSMGVVHNPQASLHLQLGYSQLQKDSSQPCPVFSQLAPLGRRQPPCTFDGGIFRNTAAMNSPFHLCTATYGGKHFPPSHKRILVVFKAVLNLIYMLPILHKAIPLSLDHFSGRQDAACCPYANHVSLAQVCFASDRNVFLVQVYFCQ